ncbi:putative E3 ubiquitin-protein ligase ARI8 [Silene latifolia]|uniref:putative E3 ubiquitin-protein ligase ARI8 n=1 Tax=Silene latifolia TaxID=37657 RepID=UPI003D78AE79
MNPDLVRLLALQGDQTLYSSLFARSYFTNNIKGKLCPTLGCNHAVLVESGKTISRFTCKCLFTFCYRCLQESHEPVSCAVANCWAAETVKQTQNWQAVFLRNCPICEQSLQVNGENKHMRCPSCNYHFCKTCLCSWLENGHWAADYFTHICTEVKLIEVAEISEDRAIASKELNRYQDTLEHWHDIDRDQHQTLGKLLTLQLAELKILAEKQGLQLSETSFVTDVWLQIAECKRVFKWASVYDYYILAFKDKNRRSLFDDLSRQGAYVMAHLCTVASELRKFIATDAPAAEFQDFRERLCFKSSVAKNFFKNMAIAIQRGYTDMKALRTVLCSRESVQRRPAEEDVGTSSRVTRSADVTSEWICEHCSFPNDNTAARICVMCYH